MEGSEVENLGGDAGEWLVVYVNVDEIFLPIPKSRQWQLASSSLKKCTAFSLHKHKQAALQTNWLISLFSRSKCTIYNSVVGHQRNMDWNPQIHIVNIKIYAMLLFSRSMLLYTHTIIY
jgi:hypothetical protein